MSTTAINSSRFAHQNGSTVFKNAGLSTMRCKISAECCSASAVFCCSTARSRTAAVTEHVKITETKYRSRGIRLVAAGRRTARVDCTAFETFRKPAAVSIHKQRLHYSWTKIKTIASALYCRHVLGLRCCGSDEHLHNGHKLDDDCNCTSISSSSASHQLYSTCAFFFV